MEKKGKKEQTMEVMCIQGDQQVQKADYEVLVACLDRKMMKKIKSIFYKLPVKLKSVMDEKNLFDELKRNEYDLVYLMPDAKIFNSLRILSRLEKIHFNSGVKRPPFVIINNDEAFISGESLKYSQVYSLHHSFNNDELLKSLYSNTVKDDITAGYDFSDIVPVFLENRRQDLLEINYAIGQNDYVKIAQIAHSIKGVSLLYGFPTLNQYAIELERYAREKNHEQCLYVLRQMQQTICHSFMN